MSLDGNAKLDNISFRKRLLFVLGETETVVKRPMERSYVSKKNCLSSKISLVKWKPSDSWRRAYLLRTVEEQFSVITRHHSRIDPGVSSGWGHVRVPLACSSDGHSRLITR